MNEILQVLALIILGLLGITSYQGRKAKDLKKEVRKAQDTIKQRERELGRINETRKKTEAIKQEQPPKKEILPGPGDTAGHLARLNRLHERANGRTDPSLP